MRLQLWKKHISNIDELLGIIYENQSIFKTLKITDTIYKRAFVKEYLKKTKKKKKLQKKLLEYLPLHTYELSQFSLSIPVKNYVIKAPDNQEKPLLKENQELRFSIQAVFSTKRSVLLQLTHYEEDKPDEVMKYAQAYITSFLEKRRSLWEKIVAFIHKMLKIKSK